MSPKVSTAGVRVAVRTKQGTLHRDAPSMQRLAHLVSGDMPPIVRLAHDSGDAVTVFHCPFCGSGQVLARSDGTIECEFCHSSFTVQIQPQFSAFPQTIDGVPVDVPGMPSNSMNPGMESGMDDPSVADAPPGEDVEPEDEEDGGEAEGDAPAFLKGSFLTHTGSALDVDDYLRHLAIECGPDRAAVIRRVKMRRGR